MPSQQDDTPTYFDKKLDQLGSTEIAALYFGYRRILADLQATQLAGRRITGGISGRLEIATVQNHLLEDALERLAERDPDKLREVLEYFERSPRGSDSSVWMELQGVEQFASHLQALLLPDSSQDRFDD